MVEETGMQAGGAATPSAETSTPEQQTQPQALTMEQIERLVTDKATRIAQSLVDKAASRLSQQAQEQIDALKLTQQALGLSNEQVEEAANKIVLNDLKAGRREQASTQQPDPQKQTQPDEPPIHWAVQELLDIFKAEEVEITETDPGYKEINAILADKNGNIHQLRKTAYKFIEQKRAKSTDLQKNAAARVVTGGQPQTNNAAPQQRARDYLTAAHRK